MGAPLLPVRYSSQTGHVRSDPIRSGHVLDVCVEKRRVWCSCLALAGTRVIFVTSHAADMSTPHAKSRGTA